MSDSQVNANVEDWFAKHRLPWSGEIWKKLDDFGIECVEDLKLPTPEFIDDLFQGEKPIVKIKAKLAWARLGGEDEFDFSDQAKEVTETETKKREEIFAKGQATRSKNEELPPLDAVVNAWRKKGQQDNCSRLCVCKALTDGHSVSGIARTIRLDVYSTMEAPWNGVGTGDKKFRSILASIIRIKAAMKNGKMEDVMNDPSCHSSMRSKSVKPGARGRKVTNARKKQEEDGGLAHSLV